MVFFLKFFKNSFLLQYICFILHGILNQIVCVLVAQSCPALCDPTDYRLPGFSVHGILQARILQWIAIPFSRSQIVD